MTKKHLDQTELQFLSVQKAAIFLDVNDSTIRKWAQSGKLHGVKIGSRGDWRFTKEALLTMIDDGSSKNKSQTKQGRYSSRLSNTQKKLENKEQELLATRERVHNLLMQAPAIVAVLQGPQHVFDLANPLYMQTIGEQRNIIGKPIREALPELKGQGFYELLDMVYRTGEPYVGNEVSAKLDRKEDGKLENAYYNFVYQPIFATGGNIDGILVHGIDVTAQVLARRKIEEQNKVLEMITSGALLTDALDFLVHSVEKQSFDGMKGSILLLDEDGLHLRHGAAPSLPKKYNEAIDGITIGQAVGSCGTAAYTKKSVIVTDIATDPLWKDFKELAKKYKLRACWSTPIFSSSHELLGTFAMYYDKPRTPSAEDRQIIKFATRTAALIIERKKGEEALRYQKSLLESQQEVSPLGILIVSPEGKVVMHNKRFANMWHFPKKVMNSERDKVALKAAQEQLIDPQAFIDKVLNCYKKRLQNHEKLHFIDGRIFERYGSPVTDQNGTYYGYAWYFLDITEQEQLARQKDEFIGIASHELKTPVTSVKAYAQVLQHRFIKSKDIQSAEMVGKMDAQIDKLTSLIADLLDVTKIESGKLQFNKNYFDFNALVTETIEQMQLTTTKHTIRKKLAENKSVYGDHDRLGQVIVNFISNAIKYSPHSDKIVVETTLGKENITLSVQDFGVGIPKKMHNKVFERFYRAGEQETYPGLGLGLYISAEIINRLGGKIWVKSEGNRKGLPAHQAGSIFSFSIPVKSRKK